MKLEYIIKETDHYINLKDLLKNHFEISDRLLIKLKHYQKLFINGVSVPVNAPLHPNDIVSVFIDFVEDNANIVPTPMDLKIVYEDDAFLIIDKPSGIPVHPSQDHFEDSLSNGVRFYFDTISLKKLIRPVNRLDKDTSRFSCFC